MQNLVLALVLLPMLTVFVGGFVPEDRFEVLFLRALEIGSIGLIVCFLLHVTGIVHSMPEAIVGGIAWGLAAFAGEYSRKLKHNTTTGG